MNINIDKFIRSKRRTISLEISRDGLLVVRAPLKVSLEIVREFVHKKRFWIKEKQELLQERFLKITPKRFVDEEEFMYLGEKYRLKIVDEHNCRHILLGENNTLQFPSVLLPIAEQALLQWYREQALQKITERVNYYTQLNGLKYKSIRVTNAERRWGSCGVSNSLNFSWRLIMTPLEVLDYVVVHEIAHIAVKDHSKRFWHKVQTIMPNYKQNNSWLRKNGHLLVL